MGKMQSLILSMMKVGMIGFGGGNALIPVIEQEAVLEKKLITKDEYDKDVIAATLTPGALPVEIASGVGLQSNGVPGMLIAGTSMALPGAFFTVLLLSVLLALSENILTQIQYASIGITAFIMCLLTQYILSTLKTNQNSRFRVLLCCVIAGVFLATGAGTLLDIFRIEGYTIPKLSTIHILLLTLLGSIVVGLIRKDGEKKNRTLKKISLKPLFGHVTVWILFFVVLSLPALIMIGGNVIYFELRGLVSSLLSFGGGDAYLTIADGLFVPEFISEYEFYNNLVLVVNVLPGSILCKTLSGIGYVYGVSLTGSVIGGVLMAIAGFACSVAASCAIFYIIYHIYDWMERIYIFGVIRKSIRVVVSGLLLTVMANLIKAGINMNHNDLLPAYTVLVIILVLYLINMVLYHRCKYNNIMLIVVSLGFSLLICNLIGV